MVTVFKKIDIGRMKKQINQYAIQCFQDEARAILDMIPFLDENFSNAVDLIFRCKGKLIVTGVGKSGHVGQKIAATLASLGTPAFFLNPLDAYHGDLGMLSSDDVLLAISYSGNTDELLRILPPVIERHIPIIAISSNPQSLLGKNAACHLTVKVDHEADPLNLAPTSSTTATMAMGDALACALVHVRNFKDADFARFHPGGSLGKRLLTKIRDVMRKDNFPVISADMNIADSLLTISNGKLGLAIVLNENKLEGIVSDGDIRRALQQYGVEAFTLPVKKIMTKTPLTINQDSSMSEAVDLFVKSQRHTFVVVDENGQFVGLLDYNDCII